MESSYNNKPYSFNFGQLLIILEEESEVLIGDINFRVSSQLPVFFNGVPSPRKGILVNLYTEERRERKECYNTIIEQGVTLAKSTQTCQICAEILSPPPPPTMLKQCQYQ